MAIDSHAHLTSETLLKQSDELVKRALEVGLEAIVNICTDEKSLQEGLLLAERFSQVYNTAAATPHDVQQIGDSFFPLVEKAAKENQLVAIGETGLDYYYEHSPKKLQQEHLVRYFTLSKECSLPIIFHCRDAFADLFALADQHYKDLPAVLHCFTGTEGEAKQVLERGWYLSMSGIVTFKRSEELRRVAKIIPLDRLLIETDSPYLAPQSKRGKQNEPAYVLETASFIADLRNISVQELIAATRDNAKRFFRLS